MTTHSGETPRTCPLCQTILTPEQRAQMLAAHSGETPQWMKELAEEIADDSRQFQQGDARLIAIIRRHAPSPAVATEEQAREFARSILMDVTSCISEEMVAQAASRIVASRAPAPVPLSRELEMWHSYLYHVVQCASVTPDGLHERAFGRSWQNDDKVTCTCGLARALAEPVREEEK